MEKLRKRYRGEIQRAVVTTHKGRRYCSSWVHFNRMDAMEKGSPLLPAAAVQIYKDVVEEEEEEEDGDEDDEGLYSGRRVIKEAIPIRQGFMIERNGGESGGGGKRREGNPRDEMVEAIKMLGDGFLRMERMKMDMAREIEGMRMETEMKRTEMIIEAQQKVVENLAKAYLVSNKNKKVKRMPSLES